MAEEQTDKETYEEWLHRKVMQSSELREIQEGVDEYADRILKVIDSLLDKFSSQPESQTVGQLENIRLLAEEVKGFAKK